METHLRTQSLAPLAERAAMLWHWLREGRAARLGPSLRKLDQAQRRLARLEASLPFTQTGERLRRRCLELRQAQNAELQRLLGKLAADDSQASSLLQHQLELSRATLAASPPVARTRSWADGPEVPEVISAACVLLALTYWKAWLFFPALAGLMLLTHLVRRRPRVVFEFNGRSLRVIMRCVWWWSCSSVVDLCVFNQVEVTTLEDRAGESYTELAVASAGGRLVLDTQPTGREIERVIAQVRAWCATAAEERR